MSVLADELLAERGQLVGALHSAQRLVQQLATNGGLRAGDEGELTAQVDHLLSLDLVALCRRSPCNDRVRKSHPITSNLTISCCKKCLGREIQLI